MQQQHNRREKSLSLLCQKFLSFYPITVSPNERIIICLDHMAQLLEVERRRIYDIVNVLESVEILSRFCKNQYIWHGFSQIPHTLSKLKTLSVKSSFLEYTKALMASQLENSVDLYQDTKQAINVCFESTQLNKINLADMKDATTQTISISREEKSLGIMSQKFLMLFLTSEDGLVSINFAARVLLGDTKNDTTELGRFKTKIRRLYDIANVLTSIGLIKKYHYNDINISKPAYKYIGPDVDVIRDAEYVFDFMNSGNPLSNSKHSLFDHFKRNLDLECNIPKFDVNTGILTSKDKKWKKQNQSVNQGSSSTSINQQSNRYEPYPVSYSNSLQAIDDFNNNFSNQNLYQPAQSTSNYSNSHQELNAQDFLSQTFTSPEIIPNDYYYNSNNSYNTNSFYLYNNNDNNQSEFSYYCNLEQNQNLSIQHSQENTNHQQIILDEDMKINLINPNNLYNTNSNLLPSFSSFLN